MSSWKTARKFAYIPVTKLIKDNFIEFPTAM